MLLDEVLDAGLEQAATGYARPVIVRCTNRLLDLLGKRSVTLVEAPPTDHDWYANLLWLDRRKCLLLTHAGTLFPVFAADVRKRDLQPLGPYIVTLIETAWGTQIRSGRLGPWIRSRALELRPGLTRLHSEAEEQRLPAPRGRSHSGTPAPAMTCLAIARFVGIPRC